MKEATSKANKWFGKGGIETPETTDTPETNSIPEAILDEFIGYVPNHLKTECYNVYGDSWRIDVWTATQKPDSFMRIFNIVDSYFVKFDGETITDKTIKPSPVSVNIFK
jgi:hypothetical protein